MVFSLLNLITYFGADMVSVAVDFFAFFFFAFLVAVSVLVFCANMMAEPDKSERLKAAIINLFI
jgi:hypothetical protein